MDKEDGIAILVEWLDRKGYFVDFDKKGDDSVDCSNKIVSINNTRTKETQLYILLHECGHILIDNNESVVKYKDVQERFAERTAINKVFTVMEEAEAWKRGKLLAKRLGIHIDEEKWNKDITRALGKYIKWAAGVL